MSYYSKILVALDLTSTDKSLLQYVDFITRSILPDTVLFVHVVASPQFPEIGIDPAMLHEDYEKRVLAKVEKKLSSLIDKYLGHRSDIKKEIILTMGSPLQEILEMADNEKVDLIIAGRKKSGRSGTVIPHKLARKANCAVLIIPKNCKPIISRMLIPVDFSNYSIAALELAKELHPKLNNPLVTCLHAFEVPNDSLVKKGINDLVLRQAIQKAIEQAFDKLITSANPGKMQINCKQTENIDGNAATIIYDYATKKKANLVIIGAKGHSTFERLVMGSVTEKFLALCDKIPVLVIKI